MGTLLNYWNNFVLATEPWQEEKEQPTLRQAWLKVAEGHWFAAHPFAQRGLESLRPYPRHQEIAPPSFSINSTTSPVIPLGRYQRSWELRLIYLPRQISIDHIGIGILSVVDVAPK